MNENPTIAEPADPSFGGVGTATPPPPPPPQGPPAPPVRPSLRRSRENRVIGGVCGGIGRQYDVDPVLLRILFVVGAVFTGGALVIVYIAAWLLMPDDPAWVPVAPLAPAGTVPPSYAAGGTGTFVDPGTGQVYGAAYQPPVVPVRRTEPRSYLGLFALSAAVVVGGSLAVLGVAGVSVPGVVVAASMLGVVGIGLLVGAFRGRARWLIAPAVILLLVAQVAAVVPKVVGSTAGSGVGERRWVPTAASTSFELGAGTATLDLSKLPSGAVAVDASIGVGELIVLVPADTRIVLDSSVGLGEIDLPGQRAVSGSNLDVERTIEPLTTTSDVTTVDLTAEVGLGTLEVRRAAS